MKNGSGWRTDTNQNAEISIMIEDATIMTVTATTDVETATTEIGTSATAPRTMTVEGTTDGTRNNRGTIITDATTEEDIFAETSVGRQPENTTGDRYKHSCGTTGTTKDGRQQSNDFRNPSRTHRKKGVK